MIIFHKNQFIDEKNLQINALSPGFQFGIGFFTTLKFVNGEFEYINDHLNRLNQSLIDFNIKSEKVDIQKILNQLIEKNDLDESRIKILVYQDIDRLAKYVIIPQTLIINNKPRRLKTKLSTRGTNQNYHYKSLNYFENIREKNALKYNEADDFMYFDEKGNILEATSSNIFFIKEGKLYTPLLDLPILGGIYRKKICEIFKDICTEQTILIDDIKKFDACFLTNSIQEIVPVLSINHNNQIIEFDINNQTLNSIRNRMQNK